MNHFSEILKRLRLAEGLTQREFASCVHLSNAVVSKYESGLSCPSIDSLIEIANFFHVSVDYLIGNNPIVADEPLRHLTKEQRAAIRALETFFYAENEKKKL